MNTTFISGGVSLILGIVVTVIAINLPEASIGISYAPRVFPTGLGILMTLFSILQLIKEYIRVRGADEKSTAGTDPYLVSVLLTCVFGFLYAILFKRIGYVLSTFLFLELELWLFNGKSNWKVNTIVALAFSVGVYLLFAKAFGVYLPKIPYLWI
jgi:putative tricarboxylic transport membrane protein